MEPTAAAAQTPSATHWGRRLMEGDASSHRRSSSADSALLPSGAPLLESPSVHSTYPGPGRGCNTQHSWNKQHSSPLASLASTYPPHCDVSPKAARGLRGASLADDLRDSDGEPPRRRKLHARSRLSHQKVPPPSEITLPGDCFPLLRERQGSGSGPVSVVASSPNGGTVFPTRSHAQGGGHAQCGSHAPGGRTALRPKSPPEGSGLCPVPGPLGEEAQGKRGPRRSGRQLRLRACAQEAAVSFCTGVESISWDNDFGGSVIGDGGSSCSSRDGAGRGSRHGPAKELSQWAPLSWISLDGCDSTWLVGSASGFGGRQNCGLFDADTGEGFRLHLSQPRKGNLSFNATESNGRRQSSWLSNDLGAEGLAHAPAHSRTHGREGEAHAPMAGKAPAHPGCFSKTGGDLGDRLPERLAKAASFENQPSSGRFTTSHKQGFVLAGTELIETTTQSFRSERHAPPHEIGRQVAPSERLLTARSLGSPCKSALKSPTGSGHGSPCSGKRVHFNEVVRVRRFRSISV